MKLVSDNPQQLTRATTLASLIENRLQIINDEKNILLQIRHSVAEKETTFNNILLIFGQTISTIFLCLAFFSIYRNKKDMISKEKLLLGIIEGK